MEVLTNYISKYGISVFVIACCIIAFIGILKLFKVFDKIKNSEVKKVVYYILDVILAFGGSAIYFATFKIPFDAHYAIFSISQVGATTALYAVYENIGVRKFVRFIIGLIKGWIIKDPNKQLEKWADKVGIEEGLKLLQGKLAEQEKSKIEKVEITEQPQ